MSKRFQDNYEMHVRPSSRKLRRIPYSYRRANMWEYTISDSMLYQDSVVPVEEVECVEILMPADRLEEIEKLLAWHESNEHKIKYHQDIVSQLREDERVRIENPIVQKAYMKYLTLLELVRT